MAYGLAIACGAALTVLLIGCYRTWGAGSAAARMLRRALLLVAPLFLMSLLFSVHQAWFAATADIVRSSTTIGQLEDAIARVGRPAALQAALRGWNAAAPAAALLVLAVLALVRPGLPRSRMGRGAEAGVGAAYVVVTAIVAGALLGQDAVQDIDAGIARLQAHIEDIESKARDHRRDVEQEAREIVRDALLEALDVASIQEQLDTVRASLSAARDEFEPYRELLQPVADGFRGATLEADFAATWGGVRGAVDALHRDRKPVEAAIPRAGRAGWSTLRIYEAGTEFRNYRLSRPRAEAGELHDVVAKVFDVVFSEGGRTELDAALDVDRGYPLTPLVVSLVEVWHEPLKPVLAAQAEALFDATVTQRQPFAVAAAAARAQVREAMTPLEAQMRPGLDEVARRLRRLHGEAARLPRSFRRFAEAAFPKRLQAFRAAWRRLLSFPSPAARRAAAALRLQAEAALDALSDPLGRHELLAAYERTMHTLARGVNDPARYQALLRLEQQHFDTREFARFTRDHVEATLAARGAEVNGRPVKGEALAHMEGRSQWLEAHRLAVEALLPEGEGDWRPEDRERILSHLALDLQFLVRAIHEDFKPETYTPAALRDRIRAYGRIAAALEPAAPQGGDSVDSAFGNIIGSSAKGALRFEVVDLIARAEARLRLMPPGAAGGTIADEEQRLPAPSAVSLQLAGLLRAERNLIAVYQNASEDRYVQALLGLWLESDRQPELGATVSAIAVASIADDSERLRVPAQGALGALRRLVRQSKDKAQELALLRRDLAALESPDAALSEVSATLLAQFLSLQKQIRHAWTETRRKLHIRGAQRSR